MLRVRAFLLLSSCSINTSDSYVCSGTLYHITSYCVASVQYESRNVANWIDTRLPQKRGNTFKYQSSGTIPRKCSQDIQTLKYFYSWEQGGGGGHKIPKSCFYPSQPTAVTNYWLEHVNEIFLEADERSSLHMQMGRIATPYLMGWKRNHEWRFSKNLQGGGFVLFEGTNAGFAW
jgi:hypothetical protein